MPWVTEEQIDRAKQVGILDYLMEHESENLKQQGPNRYQRTFASRFFRAGFPGKRFLHMRLQLAEPRE